MGGETVITLVGANREMLDGAFALAQTCENLWSRFSRDSELSQLNSCGSRALTVSPLTVALVDSMIDGFTVTDGDFNPTLVAEVVAAGYGTSLTNQSEASVVPEGTHAFTSLSDIELTDTSVRLPQGMALDPGGIAKGFAADLITAAAIRSGARGVMVSMSGDIVVAGESPQPGGWLLGVEDPFDEAAHVDVVRLLEGAVVTSSQRKKRFSSAHHLIDPRTGLSAQTRAQTVTVVAQTGARAEALAKSGFMRPTSEFLQWLPSLGAAGMVIDIDGSCTESPNWPLFR